MPTTAPSGHEIPEPPKGCNPLLDEADLAFQAFAATRKAALEDPSLLSNPYFTAMQDSAYARFRARFEAI